MNKVTHNKLKNPGILFELLVHQITADTLSSKESPAVKILKNFFVKTELSKEYKLYETLLKHQKTTEAKADIILNTIIESSKKLNRTALRKEKYNLIKEIKEYYNLEEFFKTKLSNYKVHAAFYNLMEIYNNNISNNDAIISNKFTILEHLTKNTSKEPKKDQLIEEFNQQDKDIRLLSYKVILEKFNSKYSSQLNPIQKLILKEYINSVDNTSKLRDFYNLQINEVKLNLINLNKNVKDKVTQIKVNEVINLMKEVDKTVKVKNEDLINLLQYCELLTELDKLKN